MKKRASNVIFLPQYFFIDDSVQEDEQSQGNGPLKKDCSQ
jgi:hypothetical protein